MTEARLKKARRTGAQAGVGRPLQRASIEAVRSVCDIGDVIGRDITLQPVGRSLMGNCPFHNDSTPSLSVNRAHGWFNCFGCGARGDVFAYVMLRLDLGFPDAVRHVAERCGIDAGDVSIPNSARQAIDRQATSASLAAQFRAWQSHRFRTLIGTRRQIREAIGLCERFLRDVYANGTQDPFEADVRRTLADCYDASAITEEKLRVLSEGNNNDRLALWKNESDNEVAERREIVRNPAFGDRR